MSINKIISNPKLVFLIDGIGALTSAVLLSLFLPKFEIYFGVPKSSLYFLALFPFLYLIYDVFCYFLNTNNSRVHLQVIAIANLVYCLITITIVYYDLEKLTLLGIVYFLLEFLTIIILAIIQWKAASYIKNNIDKGPL